jgi:hypothetical protein
LRRRTSVFLCRPYGTLSFASPTQGTPWVKLCRPFGAIASRELNRLHPQAFPRSKRLQIACAPLTHPPRSAARIARIRPRIFRETARIQNVEPRNLGLCIAVPRPTHTRPCLLCSLRPGLVTPARFHQPRKPLQNPPAGHPRPRTFDQPRISAHRISGHRTAGCVVNVPPLAPWR